MSKKTDAIESAGRSMYDAAKWFRDIGFCPPEIQREFIWEKMREWCNALKLPDEPQT